MVHTYTICTFVDRRLYSRILSLFVLSNSLVAFTRSFRILRKSRIEVLRLYRSLPSFFVYFFLVSKTLCVCVILLFLLSSFLFSHWSLFSFSYTLFVVVVIAVAVFALNNFCSFCCVS